MKGRSTSGSRITYSIAAKKEKVEGRDSGRLLGRKGMGEGYAGGVVQIGQNRGKKKGIKETRRGVPSNLSHSAENPTHLEGQLPQQLYKKVAEGLDRKKCHWGKTMGLHKWRGKNDLLAKRDNYPPPLLHPLAGGKQSAQEYEERWKEVLGQQKGDD